MSDDATFNRRSFLGAAGAGLLGLTGWLAGCTKNSGKSGKKELDSRFTYDVSQFEQTDPALLLYREATPIPAGLDDPKCLAVGPDNSIHLGGDRSVRRLDPAGQLQSTIPLSAKPLALAAHSHALTWVLGLPVLASAIFALQLYAPVWLVAATAAGLAT